MGGDNFNKKEKPYVNPILKALNDAKSSRESTEKRLKKELDTQLDVMVSAYLETLGLEGIIADEAIKGGTSIKVDIKESENSIEDACITKLDETTGFEFSKSWADFYNLLIEKISVADVIYCEIARKTLWEPDNLRLHSKSKFDLRRLNVWRKHEYLADEHYSLDCSFQTHNHRVRGLRCPYPEEHVIHNTLSESYYLEISWEN